MGKAVRWTLVGRRSKFERRLQRKHIILRDAGVTEKTQIRYFIALQLLLKFIGIPENPLELDEQICDWIQHCWEQGESIHIISDGLCGLHHYQAWTKKMIPQAWKLFSVWRKLESPDRAPPLTGYVVYAWANYALEHNQFEFGALLLLGFFCLLRTGEILQVCAKDLLLGTSHGIVSLHNTKSGQRDNVSEMVQFDDYFTLEFLRALKIRLSSADRANVPIWPHSAQHFRETFKRYVERFDLTQHQFRCYSLRRGGATKLFQDTGSMEMSLVKGRWSSSRVARIYISDALSFLPGLTFSPKATGLLHFWDPFSTC